MQFTELKAARVDARHVLHEQCLGNWQDSHFCSHTSTEQKEAFHCGTVITLLFSMYDAHCTPPHLTIGLITVNASQLQTGLGVLLLESGSSFYLITDWVI